MADNQADTPSLPEGQPERSREAAPEMDSIMEGFSRLLREGKEVKVLTFYKGVPIWYGAPVTSTGDESVTLKVHRYQSFALELRKEAYLKSDTHSKVLHANVADMDPNQLLVTFNWFVYTETSPAMRNAVRVEPKTRFPVEITQGEIHVMGQVCDISPMGLAALIQNPGALTPDADVRLRFQLPSDLISSNPHLRVDGTLLRIVRTGTSQRIIFSLRPSVDAEHVISQYIFNRQAEIVRELKEFV